MTDMGSRRGRQEGPREKKMEKRTKKTERWTQLEDTETLTEMGRWRRPGRGLRAGPRAWRSGWAPRCQLAQVGLMQLEVEAPHREPQHLGQENARGGSGGSDGGGRGFGTGLAALGPQCGQRGL